MFSVFAKPAPDPFTRERSVFAYQQQILPALRVWGAISVALGLLWWWRGGRENNVWWRGVGMQWAMWGAIDALIAAAGLRGVTRKADALTAGTMTAATHANEAHIFERILWVNAGLDVGYVVGGALWMRVNADAPERRGHGAGIVAQGLFLFGFDLANVLVVRTRRLIGNSHES